MITHSECKISQSSHTQFSSYGAFNLNRDEVQLPCCLSIQGNILLRKFHMCSIGVKL